MPLFFKFPKLMILANTYRKLANSIPNSFKTFLFRMILSQLVWKKKKCCKMKMGITLPN
jgi:hypothetical protein